MPFILAGRRLLYPIWSGPDDKQEVVTSIVETVENLDESSKGRFKTRKGVDMNFYTLCKPPRKPWAILNEITQPPH